MQLTLSTLFALATVLSVAALEQLKDHLTVTVVTDWTTGYISYGEESHDVAQLNDPIHVVVDGEDKVYQRVMRLNFENVDPEDTREISITRNEDGQPATPHVSPHSGPDAMFSLLMWAVSSLCRQGPRREAGSRHIRWHGCRSCERVWRCGPHADRESRSLICQGSFS